MCQDLLKDLLMGVGNRNVSIMPRDYTIQCAPFIFGTVCTIITDASYDTIDKSSIMYSMYCIISY